MSDISDDDLGDDYPTIEDASEDEYHSDIDLSSELNDETVTKIKKKIPDTEGYLTSDEYKKLITNINLNKKKNLVIGIPIKVMETMFRVSFTKITSAMISKYRFKHFHKQVLYLFNGWKMFLRYPVPQIEKDIYDYDISKYIINTSIRVYTTNMRDKRIKSHVHRLVDISVYTVLLYLKERGTDKLPEYIIDHGLNACNSQIAQTYRTHPFVLQIHAILDNPSVYFN